MSLRLIAIDPDTDGGDCPAVFIDTETGDLVTQGELITEPTEVAEMDSVSRMRHGEAAVRLPERMREAILRALQEVDGDGAATDPVR